MKKNITIIISILTIILLMCGCSQNKYEENSNNSSTEKVNNIEENSQERKNEDSNENLVSENKEKEANKSKTNKINMMDKIKEEGIKGINIYCDNIKLGDNISDVEKIYNECSEHNYVPDAKGVYYNYKNNNFAFGCNKGDQIFEIRSYDENLKQLSLQDIENYFGNPDYENKTTVGEKIIGYKISEDYKLLFVFDKETLDHYSVFYPEITANLMADDKGRQG